MEWGCGVMVEGYNCIIRGRIEFLCYKEDLFCIGKVIIYVKVDFKI